MQCYKHEAALHYQKQYSFLNTEIAPFTKGTEICKRGILYYSSIKLYTHSPPCKRVSAIVPELRFFTSPEILHKSVHEHLHQCKWMLASAEAVLVLWNRSPKTKHHILGHQTCRLLLSPPKAAVSHLLLFTTSLLIVRRSAPEANLGLFTPPLWLPPNLIPLSLAICNRSHFMLVHRKFESSRFSSSRNPGIFNFTLLPTPCLQIQLTEVAASLVQLQS